MARKSSGAGARVPVQAATTSCIVHGVTSTMNPKDMAAIVLEAVVLNRRSCVTSYKILSYISQIIIDGIDNF